MSLQSSEIRNELVHHFNAAFDYTGGCTQHQREAAHYQRGRKDGLGQALGLVDTFIRSQEGQDKPKTHKDAGCLRSCPGMKPQALKASRPFPSAGLANLGPRRALY